MFLPHFTHRAVLCSFLCMPLGVSLAEAPSTDSSSEPSEVPASATVDLSSTGADTYIPGNLTVAPFTPPTPKTPVAPLTDAADTIVVNDKEGHTVILQRGPASMAPDIPTHEDSTGNKPAPDPSQFPARPAITTLQMGGMVYDQHVSVIHWKHPQTGEEYSAVLGYDANLVGQIGKFVRQGTTYQLFMICTPQSTKGPIAELRAERGLPGIDVPQVTDEGYRLLFGNAADEVGMEPLLAMHELYLAEKSRLIKYQQDLKQYHVQEKAWKDAHPEPTSPTVFWFKPHRGSRYLTEQDKADQAAAASARADAEGASQTGQEGGNP